MSSKLSMQARSKRKKSSFSKAFWVVNAQQFWALETLYAFCREVDDIVDETPDIQRAAKALQAWENFLLKKVPACTELEQDVGQMLLMFPQLKVADLLWIIKGMRSDLHKHRYASYQELLDYCDSVASAVGLAILAIMGLNRERYYDFALATGRALQLTNILRDLKEDAQRDRIYVPKEILQACGCYERQVLNGDDHNGSLTKMMIRMDKWAQEEYEKSEQFLFEHIDDKVKSLPAQIMRKTYRCLLKKIRDKKYTVYTHKIKLSMLDKMYVLMWSVWRYCSYQVKRYWAKA